MYKWIVLAVSCLIFVNSYAFAQEPRLATFQETVQILIDSSISNNVTSAISLQSSSNQEIRIPTELVKKIQNDPRIIAVVITNENLCVLGVSTTDACIMINVDTRGIEGGIKGIQDTTKEIGNLLIADINSALDIESKFHSVYLHHRDETNVALETSGIISGKGAVSAVYTMPKEATNSMYEKFTSILIPKAIRDSGGFFKVAENLSQNDNSRMTLSILPQESITLFQIRLALNHVNSAVTSGSISPLEYLQIDELKRSEYFSQNFYPLNSLVKVVILSEEPLKFGEVNTKLVPEVIKNGERLPEFTQDGWFFDNKTGTKIESTYLFGQRDSVTKNELVFTVSAFNGTDSTIQITPSEPIDFIQILVLIGIVMAAIGAIVFYLKGYKGKS